MRQSRKILALSLATSLFLTGGWLTDMSVVQAQKATGANVLRRVITKNADGRISYRYEDESGNSVQIVNGKAAKSKLKKAVNLPVSYDLRDKNQVTPIKDQGASGACWTFAAMKSAESNAIMKGYETASSVDFSENHLAWYTYGVENDESKGTYGDGIKVDANAQNGNGDFFFPSGVSFPFFWGEQASDTQKKGTDSVKLTPYNLGGSALMAVSTLASWRGVSLENKAPFVGATDAEIIAMANKMIGVGDSLKWDSSYHLQNALCYDDASMDEKKQAIMKNGAMDVSLYFDTSTLRRSNTSFLNATSSGDYSYYQWLNDTRASNHCVTIVGWDDNFSDFKSGAGMQTPSKPGAWLIANSYGTDYQKSKNGYFWVSYEDPSLCDFYSFDIEKTDNYDVNYQYDGLDTSELLTNADEDGNVIWDNDIQLSNVYENTYGVPQEVKAVGFYTNSNNQPYEIKVYKDLKGTTPDTGTLVSSATVKGVQEIQGFHTVKLNSPVGIESGSKYAVVVNYLYKNESGDKIAVYVPVEGTNFEMKDQDSGCSEIWTYGSKPGQSFFSYDDGESWKDCYYGNPEEGRTDTYNNACIKAYADNMASLPAEETAKPTTTVTPSPTSTPTATEPVEDSKAEDTITAVSLSKKSITLGKGESTNITIKTNPSSKQKDLTYSSSNKNVATLSSSGKLSAKGVGTATITVKASSEVYAKLTVKVKKAPTSIKLNYKNKTLKKGKSLALKYTLSSGSASYKIKYSSSNSKIASVSSNGIVKAKKKGTAKVYVKTFNGKQQYVIIKVS